MQINNVTSSVLVKWNN